MRHRAIAIAAAVVVVLVLAWRHAGRRRHASKATFKPVPLLPCGPAAPPEYAVDQTGRGAGGTVTWGPYYPGIHRGRVPLPSERDAVSVRENYTSHPRYSNIPNASSENVDDGRMDNGRLDVLDAAIREDSELLTNDAPDTAKTLLASVVRRSGPVYSRSCSTVFSDIDTGFVPSGGLPDSQTTAGYMMCQRNIPFATLAAASTPAAPVPGAELTAGAAARIPAVLRIGLGSVALDPRFQPGPAGWLPSDGQPAPGTFAGAASQGALTPAGFARTGAWDATITRGFGGRGRMGDDPTRTYEAIITNSA